MLTIPIVASGDNHLGQYVAKMPPRVLDERRERLRRAFAAVVEAAIEREARLVILAGDVFDTPTPRNVERVFLAQKLAELRATGIPVVAISGNHDTPRSSTEEGGVPALRVYDELAALTVLDDPGDALVVRPRILSLDGRSVAVGGFTPRPRLPESTDPLEGVTFDGGSADLRIMVVHGIVEGTLPPAVPGPIIRRETIARLSGSVDLLVVGDVHRSAVFSCGDVTVVLPGATERLTFGDAYAPGFAWIEAEPGHLDVRHVALTPQPRVQVVLSAADLDPVNPTGSVLSAIEARANEDALAQVVLEGVLPREAYRRLNAAKIEELGRRAFFSFELDLTQLAVRLDPGRDIAWTPRRSLADAVRAVVEEHWEATPDPDERAILDDTRAALLNALADEGEEIQR